MPEENLEQSKGIELVDEYAKLHAQSAQLEKELEAIKTKLISFAQSKGVKFIRGSTKTASLNSYALVSFPPKADRGYIDNLIKEQKLWEQLSELDTHKLAKALKENKLPEELSRELKLIVKKKEMWRVILS